jgi:MFS family permease
MFAVSLAVLSHAFPKPGERAKALAAYGASIGAAFAIGPAVGGALTSGLDWRWIFLVNIPFGLACLAITQRFVVESRDPHARRIDWSGQALLIVGLFVLVLALLRGNEDGWGSPLIVTLLAGSVASLVAFVAVERRSPHAMLPLELFRNPDFTGAQVAAFAISATFFAVFIYMTLYLQQILGLSAIEAGLVYLPGTIVMFFVSGATAALGEKVSAKAMIVGGLVLVAAGMGWIAMVAEVGSSWTAFLPGSIVAMIGSGLFNPALSAVALGSVPTEQSGLAAGVNDTFRQAGIAVGVAALGALVPAAAAFGDGSPQSYVDGMNDALWVCVVACLAGAAASAALIRGRRSAPAVRPELALDAA